MSPTKRLIEQISFKNEEKDQLKIILKHLSQSKSGFRNFVLSDGVKYILGLTNSIKKLPETSSEVLEIVQSAKKNISAAGINSVNTELAINCLWRVLIQKDRDKLEHLFEYYMANLCAEFFKDHLAELIVTPSLPSFSSLERKVEKFYELLLVSCRPN